MLFFTCLFYLLYEKHSLNQKCPYNGLEQGIDAGKIFLMTRNGHQQDNKVESILNSLYIDIVDSRRDISTLIKEIQQANKKENEIKGREEPFFEV